MVWIVSRRYMRLLCFGLGLLFLFSVISCTFTPTVLEVDVAGEKYCVTDSDCVASLCCHATDALNKDHAPECTAVLCSMDCQEGTLDCGQGHVACVENACTVVFDGSLEGIQDAS